MYKSIDTTSIQSAAIVMDSCYCTVPALPMAGILLSYAHLLLHSTPLPVLKHTIFNPKYHLL